MERIYKKYVYPRDLSKACRWYLMVLRGVVNGVTFDEFIALLGTEPPTPQWQRNAKERIGRLIKSGFVNHNQKTKKYAVTTEGIAKLEEMELKQLRMPSGYKWDGRWRIVIFDIPEESREARYHIRKLLKDLGFMKLQLSVWINPLPCLEQFRKISEAYGISYHLHLIESVNFAPPKVISSRFSKLHNTNQFNWHIFVTVGNILC